jgi:SWI/SNF-related matrix-associated actin-dependent regulator 1 of chromatin subfamily A
MLWVTLEINWFIEESKMITNRFANRCVACKQNVNVAEGFAIRNDEKWQTYCRNCVPQRAGSARRVLTSDGKIIMPYEPENLPLVKSLPGARWNANEKCWSVSLEMSNRQRILEVADKIGLQVASVLRSITVTQQAQQAQQAGLYQFQVDGVNFLSQRKKALLGDEMGLGKSVQSLMGIPQNGSAMVICRAGLKYNWLDEVRKWRKDLTPVVLEGRTSFRWPKKGEVVIINNDILPEEFNTPVKERGENTNDYFVRLNQYRIDLKNNNNVSCNLIIDEAHDYKNRKAARSRKVKEISLICDTTIALTGSPLTNRPEDLYGVLDTIGLAKEVFGNFERFQSLFNATRNRFGVEYGKPNAIVPELLRRVMLRRRREEVLPELPNKTYTHLTIGNTDSRLKEKLDKMWSEWSGVIENQILPPFQQFAEIRADLAQSRIETMLDYINDSEEQECPLVVFSAHLAPLEILKARTGWAVITGETKPEHRQEIVRDFQNGKLKGVGISIRAGGVGLTLTHAWKALFVDLDWTPASNWQAEDRICRIGQLSKKVEIVRMVSDHPLDIHIQNLLINKIDTINRSIDASIAGKKINANVESEQAFQERMNKVAEIERKNAEEESRKVKEYSKSKVQEIHSRETAKKPNKRFALTPERSEQVRQAFQFMLGVCDGAHEKDNIGFNKPDAAVAHILLSAGLENEMELEAGFLILSRYHRQLKQRYPLIFSS